MYPCEKYKTDEEMRSTTEKKRSDVPSNLILQGKGRFGSQAICQSSRRQWLLIRRKRAVGKAITIVMRRRIGRARFTKRRV